MLKATLPVARHRGRQHPGRSTRGAFRFSATPTTFRSPRGKARP